MRIIAITAIILLTGCGYYEGHRLKEEAKVRLRRDLYDPASAQFRDVRIVYGKSGKPIICGEMNGRNRLGGMVGFEPFIVRETTVVYPSMEKNATDAYRRFIGCVIRAMCDNPQSDDVASLEKCRSA